MKSPSFFWFYYLLNGNAENGSFCFLPLGSRCDMRWETWRGEEGGTSWRLTQLFVENVICLKFVTSKRRRNVWGTWANYRAWQLDRHDTLKCHRRRNRQAFEAGAQNYKAPLWAWPWLASMAPVAQPLADRVNTVVPTPALLQTRSAWPGLQGLDRKLSSIWCSSYLWPKR